VQYNRTTTVLAFKWQFAETIEPVNVTVTGRQDRASQVEIPEMIVCVLYLIVALVLVAGYFWARPFLIPETQALLLTVGAVLLVQFVRKLFVRSEPRNIAQRKPAEDSADKPDEEPSD
jgi:hypothetical protein